MAEEIEYKNLQNFMNNITVTTVITQQVHALIQGIILVSYINVTVN